jgi:hypothetical protein
MSKNDRIIGISTTQLSPKQEKIAENISQKQAQQPSIMQHASSSSHS